MSKSTQPVNCPLPDRGGDCITLAHGEGGRLMRELIRHHLVPVFANDSLGALGDAAPLPAVEGELAMTTDAFVVSPLFFPGGDIGSLAVYGTINDLAVAGAQPLWISLAMIIEEGLPLETLDRVLASAARAARECGVAVVAGDTKVVPRQAADGLFLITTGLGRRSAPHPPGPTSLQVDDELLVSGPIGRHGIAVLACREQLEFDPCPTSDSRSLCEAVAALRSAGVPLRAMRDATRGGVGAVLHEWAEACGRTMQIDEARIPVTPDVRGACELLGLDPLHVANEGTMVIAVECGAAEQAERVLRQLPPHREASRVGQVQERRAAAVVVRRLGHDLPLDEPLGAMLPRIC